MELFGTIVTVLVLVAFFVLWNTLLIVPAREEVVKERLGKLSAVLTAGFHMLIPFIDRVAYPAGASRAGNRHPAAKLRIVSALSRNAQELSLAGIRVRHPEASERGCLLRLAEIKLGRALTERLYPDAKTLLGP